MSHRSIPLYGRYHLKRGNASEGVLYDDFCVDSGSDHRLELHVTGVTDRHKVLRVKEQRYVGSGWYYVMDLSSWNYAAGMFLKRIETGRSLGKVPCPQSSPVLRGPHAVYTTVFRRVDPSSGPLTSTKDLCPPTFVGLTRHRHRYNNT